MRASIDVAREAVRLWQRNHGGASLDQQCQRFDGYYWQWAYQGSEQGITTYATATAAADASTMYSTSINDPRAAPGDLANWWWDPAGHVATVLGHDNGRVVVSHTSGKGDTVLALGNHVKVSHADTIGLAFRGYSHTNGRNLPRTGLQAWPTPSSTPQGDTDMTPEQSRKLDALYDAVFTEKPTSRGTKGGILHMLRRLDDSQFKPDTTSFGTPGGVLVTLRKITDHLGITKP